MKTAHKAGFTLVEMIVAMILLVVAVGSALGAFSAINRANGQAAAMQTAAILAQQKMSDIEMHSDQITGGDQQGDFGDAYPGYSWHQNIQATDYTNLFLVTVTVQWGTGNSTSTRSLTCYLRNDLQQQDQNDIQILQNQQSGTTGTGNGG